MPNQPRNAPGRPARPAWRSSRVALVALGILATLWTAWVIRDLLLSVAVAGFIVILFAPARAFLLRKWGHRRTLVALVLTAGALLLIVLPVAVVLYFIVAEVLRELASLKAQIGTQGVVRLFDGELPSASLRAVHALQRLVPIPTDKLEEQLAQLAQKAPATVGGLLRVSAKSLLNMLFVSLGLFYFFLDGDKTVAFLRDVSPLKRSHTEIFLREFRDVAWGMLFGSVLSAVSGAVVCVLGFWLLGVPHFVFWALLTGIFTLAPAFGSALIWVPLCAVLLLQGHLLQAIGVAAFCLLALVVINDNLLRPLIVGQRLRLHPYLILLSIFGGVEAYGIAGLLVGPMAATLAVAALRLYRADVVAARGISGRR